MRDGQVETRPIKGTRPRGRNSVEDQAFATELLASEKDRAENLMIVDLLRNDISRVCRMGSVKVPVLWGLESYATVHHLVSVVTGEMLPDKSAVDLLDHALRHVLLRRSGAAARVIRPSDRLFPPSGLFPVRLQPDQHVRHDQASEREVWNQSVNPRGHRASRR